MNPYRHEPHGWHGPRGSYYGRGNVKFAILDLLKEQPRHGYDIIREMEERSGGIYKALTFGLLIGWVCCYKGYHSRFGAEGVSAATTQAVVNASVLILVWDYFVTTVVF